MESRSSWLWIVVNLLETNIFVLVLDVEHYNELRIVFY